MTDIESLGFSLVFPVTTELVSLSPPDDDKTVKLRAYVRALQGMQKEALVLTRDATGQQSWRMVSDEGPYLNGTDLAPFPLAFFSAGMQFSLLAEILTAAQREDVKLTSLALVQDNYYTMEGSALQGTMLGGARPVEVTVKVETDAPAQETTRLVEQALQRSAAHALMRQVLQNEFALTRNGEQLEMLDVRPWREPETRDLEALFAAVRPDGSEDFDEPIIERVSQAEQFFGVEGGASSSLQAEQKRTLHVHGEAVWRGERLLETTIQLYRPIGSTFRFLCELPAGERTQQSAPPPLAYLSAGIGFCFMTQIGRYATITRQSLQDYKIIQDNSFTVEEGVTRAAPIATHVYLEIDELDEVAQKTVWMSERTCFLHAAMRDSFPSIVKVEANGEAIQPEDEPLSRRR